MSSSLKLQVSEGEVMQALTSAFKIFLFMYFIYLFKQTDTIFQVSYYLAEKYAKLKPNNLEEVPGGRIKRLRRSQKSLGNLCNAVLESFTFFFFFF